MPVKDLMKFERVLGLQHNTQHGDSVELLAANTGVRVQWGNRDEYGDLLVNVYEFLEFRHYPELRSLFDPQTGWNYREVTDFIRGMDQDFQPGWDSAFSAEAAV